QPQDLMPQGFMCPLCRSTDFRKEQDILDVWFDSGISHFAVLRHGDGFPADMYLEGKDQHRGWFQSSVLTGMVLEDRPPMRTIVTHGFTVDDKGRKMSKSLGNGVEPKDLVEKLGTDGLRLWAASIDCTDDAVVSELLLKNVKEVNRKIRNTARFLLSNLYDFDPAKDAVPYENLRVIDQYALAQAYAVNAEIIKRYKAYDFTAIFHALADYCSVDLSAFYQDISKDRLYVERASGHPRRSAQTVYWYILDMMTRAMAPILSITAEQLSDVYQKDKKQSIHLQNFAWLEPQKRLELDQETEAQWQALKDIRSVVLKAIEGLREQGIVKLSLEANVRIYMDETLTHALQGIFDKIAATDQSKAEFFKEFFIVSQLDIAPDATDMVPSSYKGLYVHVQRASGDKCPRCWQWTVTDHEHKLCARCEKVIT
ncbi:MAG TPA: class I tRNA ligase family protein, partial [Candidatus Limnocylindria bacterium]|nr:class I tRNA ligase family protein [Candidatus Limnocylindria bacterium]